jgi:hypothetical protein
MEYLSRTTPQTATGSWNPRSWQPR